jgi:hypothetical protein
MKVKTDLNAGEALADISATLQETGAYLNNAARQTGAYLSRLFADADAQANTLMNDVIFTTSSLAECLNTKFKNRS